MELGKEEGFRVGIDGRVDRRRKALETPMRLGVDADPGDLTCWGRNAIIVKLTYREAKRIRVKHSQISQTVHVFQIMGCKTIQ